VTGADAHAPRRLPMFPLGTVLFPGSPLPLHVFEDRYRAMVVDCLAGDRRFGVVLISRGSEVGGGDERVGVGTEAVIEAARPFDDGRWGVLARGCGRIEVVEWLPDAPYPAALVRDVADGDGSATVPGAAALDGAAAAVARARALASELGRPLDTGVDTEDEAGPGATPDDRLWRLCAGAPLGPFDRQRLLEAATEHRAGLLTELASALGDDLAAML
jgi:Lon protease-like protein